MHIEILDDAKEDILIGSIFYESQQYGIGDYFLDSISLDIESLRLFTGIHPIKFKYHRLLSKQFPYSIYYKIDNDIVKIYAVLDDRRDPSITKSRLLEQI